MVPCQYLLQPASGESHFYLQHLRSLSFSCYSQCRRLLPQQTPIKSLTGFGPVSNVNSVLKSPEVGVRIEPLVSWYTLARACMGPLVFLLKSEFPCSSILAPCSCTRPPSSLGRPVPSRQNQGRSGQSSLPNTTCSLLGTAYHMTSAGSLCPALTSRGSSWRPVSSTLTSPTGESGLWA